MPGFEPAILHVGNILNNGYLHCKFLRNRGVPADVLNVDYRHCQGQPEWAEVAIKTSIEEWNPAWDKIDLNGFKRPDWFFDVSTDQLSLLADALATGQNFSDLVRCHASQAATVASVPARQKFMNIYMTARHAVGEGLAFLGLKEAILRNLVEPLSSVGNRAAPSQSLKIAKGIRERWIQETPDAADKLTLSDILEYLPRALKRQPVLRRYSLTQAYALDPIDSILAAPDRPLICYEHGTMRDFPFEESARGRLYSLALKRADKVMITNADCKGSADRLGLTNAIFIPHIVDDDLFKPAETALREQLKRQSGCDHILVAPARHHWKNAPPGLENSWFKRNDILIRGLARLHAERPALKILTVFFDWGQEVELSKALIRECGIADRVLWAPLHSKPVLKEYYNAADVVLDQFNAGIGTFGGVLPESMACAKPVVLNYKEDIHRWCYPEPPPALNASDEDGVARHLIDLLENEALRRNIGLAGRRWFRAHHSSDLVIDRMIDVYRSIWEKYGWQWPFGR